MNECPVCNYLMEDTGTNYVCTHCGHVGEDYPDLSGNEWGDELWGEDI